MAIIGYMRTEVKIAEFKNGLSRYLRSAQKGAEIIIKDRETPIARLVPYREEASRLAIKPGLGSLKAVDRLPFYAPKGLKARDVDQALREERRERLTGGLE